ncbi:MAG: hypothetical protein Q7R43_05185 [Candidatus Daviesbacteria bacterium]|nr:hypothetical protein [Candidatus Daviesbacteria bacterium]
MNYIEGVPPLFIDGLEIPSLMPEDKYLKIKEAIAEKAIGKKGDIGKVVDDAYIAVPTNEGGLGADSLGLVEIIMEVEDILETEIPDNQAEVVGRVYHVAHLYNVREAEIKMPGILDKWLAIRNREIDEYLAQRGKSKRNK